MAAGAVAGSCVGGCCTLQLLLGLFVARNSRERCNLNGAGEFALPIMFCFGAYFAGEAAVDNCCPNPELRERVEREHELTAVPVVPEVSAAFASAGKGDGGAGARPPPVGAHVINPLVVAQQQDGLGSVVRVYSGAGAGSGRSDADASEFVREF